MEISHPVAIALSVAGIVALLYGGYIGNRLRMRLKKGRVKETWDQLLVLIGVFLAAHLLYLLNITMGLQVKREVLVSTAFFFGSVFVALAAYLNYDALT